MGLAQTQDMDKDMDRTVGWGGVGWGGLVREPSCGTIAEPTDAIIVIKGAVVSWC